MIGFDFLSFAAELVGDAVGDKANYLKLSPLSDAPFKLPVVIIDVTAPRAIPNGRFFPAANFSINIQCYADRLDDAYRIARTVNDDLLTMWRRGYSNQYGALSHISANSSGPVRVPPAIDGDDIHRFDLLIHIVARATSHT